MDIRSASKAVCPWAASIAVLGALACGASAIAQPKSEAGQGEGRQTLAVGDAGAWLKDRQTRFAAYRAAHPHPNAEIAAIKAKTLALIDASATPPNSPAPDADSALDRAPAIWRVSASPTELWDGAGYPEMIVVPAGEYTMGSPVTEPGRQAKEGPRHRVRIGYSFAVSKYPVTIGEFAQFVAETKYDAGDQCYTFEQGSWESRSGRNWRQVGFAQAITHPVVCMNYNDAQAYVAWLSRKTGHAYRLLSEAEYEYADRAGSTTAYWWGNDPTAACAYANGFDQDAKALNASWTPNTCRDGYVFTSPVGSLQPNPFGLYDTTGNAWSWLSDCWDDFYNAAPADGSANTAGDCGRRSLRGGSWNDDIEPLRVARRLRYAVGDRYASHGFRVARTY